MPVEASCGQQASRGLEGAARPASGDRWGLEARQARGGAEFSSPRCREADPPARQHRGWSLACIGAGARSAGAAVSRAPASAAPEVVPVVLNFGRPGCRLLQ